MIPVSTPLSRARPSHRVSWARALRVLTACILLVVTAGIPARAQPMTVEMLLARIFSTDDREPYDLTANFTGTLALVVGGSRLVGMAVGTFHEWRAAAQPKHWKVMVQRLELPTLLHPFAGALRRAIEDKAAEQSESLETLRSHDLFILEERPGGRYLLAGIRRDLIDEAIDRYGQPQHKLDPATRRYIARWLYTSPSMREWIVRRGGPYALQTVADDQGLVHDLVLRYNWGQIDMTFAYVTVDGQALWREVSSQVASDVNGVGHVDGQLTLTFSQYRLSQVH